MGLGQFQIPDGVDCTPPLTYVNKDARYSNNITLFKGATRYSDASGNPITLASAFLGRSKGQVGTITLSNGSRSDIAHYTPLVWFDVKVSGSLVGGSAGTVNRGIETYVHAGNLLNLFLSGISTTTTTTANTNTTADEPTATVNVNTNSSNNGVSRSVRSITELETLAVNGNKNVLSLKNGNLTIESCPNNTLTIDGVRTIIIENGNLIIRCNIVYADALSSWAFIVK